MIDDGPHENMDIDMNTRNSTSIVTTGDSSGHDMRLNAPIPIDMAMSDYPEFSPMGYARSSWAFSDPGSSINHPSQTEYHVTLQPKQ